MSSGSGKNASLSRRLWKFIEAEDSEGVHEVLSSVQESRHWSHQDFSKFFDELHFESRKNSDLEETEGNGDNHHHQSALHWAARKLSCDVMRVLLEFGANADSTGGDNEAPVFVVLKRLSGTHEK